jgi:transcriptional regulator with XRE-family HTH domain
MCWAQPHDANVSKQAQQWLGKRVRQLRRKHGWSQAELADRLGLNVTYLGLLERGHKNVCLDTMEVLTRGFGMSMSKLLSGL